MPRVLTERECAANVMRIHDPVSGAAVRLIYRLPSTGERAEYLGSLLRREGEAAVSALLETRRRFGLALLRGLGERDFELPGEGAASRAISSDPASAAYEPHWKELLAERAPELAEALAYHVFEGHYASPGVSAGDASKKN